MNKVQLIGNLGRDPEIRTTQNGTKIATLSVATAERWKDKQSGERREKTEWHRVVIFGALAGVAESYLFKGSQVYLEGQLQTRKWQDQSGQDRYTTEVVLSGFKAGLELLDSRSNNDGQRQQQYGDQRNGNAPSGSAPEAPQLDDLDDEIPFAVPFDIPKKRGIRA